MQTIADKIKQQARDYYGNDEKGKMNLEFFLVGIDQYPRSAENSETGPNENFGAVLKDLFGSIGVSSIDSETYFRESAKKAT